MVGVMLDEKLNARFEASSVICPDDSAFFKNLSTGNATRWEWNFDNGKTAVTGDPSAQFYPPTGTNRNYTPSLNIWDANGCTSSSTGLIKVIANCNIDVPSAFTPNGDGINDFFYPLNTYKTQNLLFRIYNRFGQIVLKPATGSRNGMAGSAVKSRDLPLSPGRFPTRLKALINSIFEKE